MVTNIFDQDCIIPAYHTYHKLISQKKLSAQSCFDRYSCNNCVEILFRPSKHIFPEENSAISSFYYNSPRTGIRNSKLNYGEMRADLF